ncbi:MAG: hypothetical protein SFW36_01100 [Leptolyngbyaceae cyanobacterium bins.59]|nr:hypothetical protein [Leptolyngbyaceae cyanobacterium bins.59]
MAFRTSLLSTAGFLTLVVTIAGAFRLIPDQQMRAELAPSPLAQSLILRPVHPDESVSETLKQRFVVGNALERVEQVRSALGSFQKLTQKSTATVRAGVANTDWETQNLGFHNWVSSIEGTLHYQDYQIKKLELELAKKQYEDREIDRLTLEQKMQAFQKVEREFQTYWNSYKIAD